jgi:hypothetical protein
LYLLVPFAGFLLFFRIKKIILSENVLDPPIIEIFSLIFYFGALLILTLSLFLKIWSSFTSVVATCVVLTAPILMSIIAFNQYKLKSHSRYNYLSFIGSLTYLFALFLFIYLVFFQINNPFNYDYWD